ncbi:preprotein translocase subunit SecG [Candidatus Margulisiibacteriota bacterium]
MGFLIFIQLIISVLLVIAVLLHSAKGEGLAGIGGSANLFATSKEVEKGLDKITAFLAFSFMAVALLLAIFGTQL